MTIPAALPAPPCQLAAIAQTPLALLNTNDVNEMLTAMTVDTPPADGPAVERHLRSAVQEINAAAAEVLQVTAAMQRAAPAADAGQSAVDSQRQWLKNQAKTVLATYKAAVEPPVSQSTVDSPPALKAFQHTYFPNRVKFNAAAVAILRKWMADHSDDQYPDLRQKEQLAKTTGMTYDQVSNWFINHRSRAGKKSKRARTKPAAIRTTKRRRLSFDSDGDNTVAVHDDDMGDGEDHSPVTPLLRPRASVSTDAVLSTAKASQNLASVANSQRQRDSSDNDTAAVVQPGTAPQLLDSVDKIIYESSHQYLSIPKLELPQLSMPLSSSAVSDGLQASLFQSHARPSLSLAMFVQEIASAAGRLPPPLLRSSVDRFLPVVSPPSKPFSALQTSALHSDSLSTTVGQQLLSSQLPVGLSSMSQSTIMNSPVLNSRWLSMYNGVATMKLEVSQWLR